MFWLVHMRKLGGKFKKINQNQNQGHTPGRWIGVWTAGEDNRLNYRF